MQIGIPLYPPFLLLTRTPMTDITFMFLLTACLCLYLYALRVPKPPRRVRVVLYSSAALSGFALVAIRPTGLVVAGAIIAVEAYQMLRKRKSAAATASLVLVFLLVGAALFTTVWSARNAMIFHRFIPLSTGSSWFVFEGNHLESKGTATLPPGAHWIQDAETRAKMADASEPELMDLYSRLFREEFSEHPVEVLGLVPYKFLRFWLNLGHPRPPSRASLALAVFNACYLILAGLGLWRLLRDSRDYWRQLGTIVLLFSILLMLLHLAGFSYVRYSYPALLLLAVPVAVGVQRLLERVRKTGGDSQRSETA